MINAEDLSKKLIALKEKIGNSWIVRNRDYVFWGLSLILMGIYLIDYKRISDKGKGDFHDNEVIALKKQIIDLLQENQTLLNKDGQSVADTKIKEVESSTAIKQLSDSIFNLNKRDQKRIKEINSLTQINQQLSLKTEVMPFLPESLAPAVAYDSSGHPYTDSISVPQSFAQRDSLLDLYGRVLKEGVKIDSGRVYNTVSIRFGRRAKGFLNLGRENFGQAINSNPMITNVGMANVSFTPPVNQWNKIYKPALSAVIAFLLAIFLVK